VTTPAPGTPLCRFADLADRGARGFCFEFGDVVFRGFVVRRGDEVFGWRDRCPHIGLPLTLGDDRYLTREGRFILCCNHGALFRIADGACIAGPCVGQRLKVWPVTVRQDLVIAV
jgi:nitrite reductase/ring-hydroxylating ferredoxin subunit